MRWDWAVPAVALLVLLTIVQIWWSTQNLGQQQGPLTIGAYLPLVVQLILLFLLAAAVLPDEVPPDGLDLRTYYDENGSYVWALYSAALGWATVTRLAAATREGRPLAILIDTSVIDLLILALMVSLIFVRRWWNAVVLLILFMGAISWLSRSLG